MIPRPFQRCTRCVMDTSDPAITFDDEGRCNHCRDFFAIQRREWHPDAEGERRWRDLVDRLRREGLGRRYDCILGISGGLDSSFLALRLVRAGVRPLAVHVDGGWNSEIAVGNIERLVNRLGLDLHTTVIDWDAMRSLQLAFLRAGVPNQDIPQDHAFFTVLQREARRHGIRCFLSGHNLATESILPAAWGFDPMDGTHLRAIHARFGTGSLRRFPVQGFWERHFVMPHLLRLRTCRPLNWLAYDKSSARDELAAAVEWRDYGGKHHESRFTRFFQAWYLPTRFGWDKRLAHLSSLIVAGSLTRAEALAELAQPPYDPDQIAEDRRFIARKLGLDEDAFAAVMQAPRRRHEDFPHQGRRRSAAKRVRGALGNLIARARR